MGSFGLVFNMGITLPYNYISYQWHSLFIDNDNLLTINTAEWVYVHIYHITVI